MLTVTQNGPFKIISGVARVMPEILSFTQRRLEAVQDVIYYGSEAGPVSIKQAVGLTQGQATIGKLYSLGIHPLNEELSALFGSSACVGHLIGVHR